MVGPVLRRSRLDDYQVLFLAQKRSSNAKLSESSLARNSVKSLGKHAYLTRTALGLVAVMALWACATPKAPKVLIAEHVAGGEASTAAAAYLFDGDLYLHTGSEEGPVHATAKAGTFMPGGLVLEAGETDQERCDWRETP